MRTDAGHDRLRRWATLAVAATAAASVELALFDSALMTAIVHSCVAIAIMLILDAIIARVACRGLSEKRRARIVGAMAIAAAAAPWVWQLLVKLVSGYAMDPIEMTALSTTRNLIIVFAVTERLVRQDHLIGIMSVCAVAGAVTVGAHPAVGVAMALYCLAMGWWLVVRYWSQLPPSLQGSVATAPWMTLSVVTLLVVAIVGVRGVSRAGSGVRPLAQVAHASGGERDASADALSGVGVGPEAAGASTDASASGHTEAEVFAKSHLPSLIDLLSEQYGDPLPPEVVERAVGLRPDQDLIADREVRETASPNSRFSLLRSPADRARRTRHKPSDALLFVEGATPQHLRLATYDRFDGIEWLKSTQTQSVPSTIKFYNRPGTWMVIPAPYSLDIYGSEKPELKIQFGRIETETLPMPNHTLSFHVSHIDDPKFFRCESDARVRMTRQMPDGHVVDVVTRVIDPDRLEEGGWPERAEEAPRFWIGSRTAAIASEWGQAHPRGWKQIQHVVRRVRELGSGTSSAAPVAVSGDPVQQLLTHEGEAPDYLLASATAAILNALGYETRLVSGFYVNPDRYDWFRDHTPVYLEDVHTWCEVRRASGVWITLEPTPGYVVAASGDGRFRQLIGLVHNVVAWLGRNWPVCLGIILAAAALWHLRRGFADAIATSAWRVRAGTLARDRLVLSTVRLIELRSRLIRRPRPSSQTWTAWAGGLVTPGGDPTSIELLVAEANRCAYSTRGSDPRDDRILRTCAGVVREYTRSRLKQMTERNHPS